MGKSKKDPFNGIADFMNEEVINGWKDTLDGFRDESVFVPQHKEAFHGAMNDKSILNLMDMFEKKFGRKLKFRQFEGKSLYYVSYVETELGPEYDRTVLNKHMESFTAFKRDEKLNELL